MRTGRVRPKGGGPFRTDESEEASGHMETTSQAVAQTPGAEDGQEVPSARRTIDGYLRAPFPGTASTRPSRGGAG